MRLSEIEATRYVTPLREGGSLPALVEASDDGLYAPKVHGAALYFHHAGQRSPGHERTPFAAIEEHVLLPFAGSIGDADARLAPGIDADLLREIAAAVPADWLGGEDAQVYVDYLLGRLAQPRAFVDEADRARERR